MKKHFSGIFLIFVSSLFSLSPTIVGAFNSPASGTLSVSSTSVNVGDQITITISGQDNDDLYSLEVYYNGTWNEQKVSAVSAIRTWTITENSPATYRYCGKVVGWNPEPDSIVLRIFGDKEKEYFYTNCINVNVFSSSNYGPNYLSCYGNNIYWFNFQGERIGRYQECGINQICQNAQCVNAIQTVYECTSGPCCDGRYYKPATASCNFEIQTEYNCPWGSALGADVGKRTKTRLQYCSGISSQCNGNLGDWLTWTNWTISDYCSNNEFCVAGNSQCQTRTITVQPLSSTYTKYFRKSCYNNDLYWFDSQSVKQDKNQECSDNNECTSDGCQNQSCVNELKCDGTTCKTDSEDYVNACKTGETSCPTGQGGLIISLLGKKEDDSNQWLKNLNLQSGDGVDFTVIVTYKEKETINEATLKLEFPKEITYKGDLKIDGVSNNGDPTNSINIGSFSSNSKKTITFRSKIQSSLVESGEREIIGRVTAGNLSNSDSVKINITTSKGVAAVGLLGFITSLAQKQYFWILIIIAFIVLLFIIFRRIFSLKLT